MASSKFTHLFIDDKQSNAYAEYRPSYPSDCPAVYTSLLKDLPSNDLAIDIATGTGQAVAPLARHFKHVIATDTSQSQIDNARAPEGTHVEFKVGDAHDTGLPGGQADLVTIAQALHWLDRPRFYNEASRLLRPGGALCILTYDFGHLKLLPSDSNGDAEAANKLLAKIWDFGSTSDAFGPYWAAPRTLVDNRYRDIEPLEPTFEHITREQFDMVKQVSIAQLTGYMRSFSAYVTERKANPKGEDPAVRLERDLGAVLEAHPGQLELVQCLTLIKGFKPQQ